MILIYMLLTLIARVSPSTTIIESVANTVIENVTLENSLNKNDPKPPWLIDALKDIAYYLRAHKFNEYDRRYETDTSKAKREYYKGFPKPPLRSLHWEVHKNCEPSFMDCVDYLRKKLKYVTLKRNDDTSIVMVHQGWKMINNSKQIEQIDEECQKFKKTDYYIAKPFEGPIERYQWRVTASYYMCWYTMKEVDLLEHLSESCDNFSDCLDRNLGPNNQDQRANDADPYHCALYSFCPDPCCPTKHLTLLENCWNTPDNPCFQNNPVGQRECVLKRSQNTDFRDIILNRWNVTCRCPKEGYEWNSLYGMCIDVDECAARTHDCDPKLEACVNLPGSFKCACKWGHTWNAKLRRCNPSPALSTIKLLSQRNATENRERKAARSLIKRIIHFFIRQQPEPNME